MGAMPSERATGTFCLRAVAQSEGRRLCSGVCARTRRSVTLPCERACARASESESECAWACLSEEEACGSTYERQTCGASRYSRANERKSECAPRVHRLWRTRRNHGEAAACRPSQARVRATKRFVRSCSRVCACVRACVLGAVYSKDPRSMYCGMIGACTGIRPSDCAAALARRL